MRWILALLALVGCSTEGVLVHPGLEGWMNVSSNGSGSVRTHLAYCVANKTSATTAAPMCFRAHGDEEGVLSPPPPATRGNYRVQDQK